MCMSLLGSEDFESHQLEDNFRIDWNVTNNQYRKSKFWRSEHYRGPKEQFDHFVPEIIFR
jgi:hypothetical protein